MIAFLHVFNRCIGLIMFVLYFYQMVYVLVALIQRRRDARAAVAPPESAALHRYAVLIPARNEQAVIGHLIESLRAQNYPSELIDIYVIADNCTDDTAEVARAAGATVLERRDTERVGKGYALDDAFQEIFKQYDQEYEAFAVFDADNLVDENFFQEINRLFDSGSRVITSYRNSKNFGQSWVSSCSALWYLRESRFLNAARAALHSSCLISGTGFVVARDILLKNNGWKHHLLTEDIEFSIDSVIQGERIDFCESAMVYDEQPLTFRQSWDQRLRWAKGFYQVFRHYGLRLICRLFRCPKEQKLSCYDLLMMILPAMLVTVLGVAVNLAALIGGLCASNPALAQNAGFTLATTLINFYLLFFAYGALTLICERRMVQASLGRQISCLFVFPIFTFSYIPMSIQALFCSVEWKPIAHTYSKTVSDMRARQ